MGHTREDIPRAFHWDVRRTGDAGAVGARQPPIAAVSRRSRANCVAVCSVPSDGRGQRDGAGCVTALVGRWAWARVSGMKWRGGSLPYTPAAQALVHAHKARCRVKEHLERHLHKRSLRISSDRSDEMPTPVLAAGGGRTAKRGREPDAPGAPGDAKCVCVPRAAGRPGLRVGVWVCVWGGGAAPHTSSNERASRKRQSPKVGGTQAAKQLGTGPPHTRQ